MKKLLYGVAYYDEYMPYDRLDQDIQMMKEVGINLVRIAESTWSTHEPQNGVVLQKLKVDSFIRGLSRNVIIRGIFTTQPYQSYCDQDAGPIEDRIPFDHARRIRQAWIKYRIMLI